MTVIANPVRAWARFHPGREALADAGTGRRWTWAALAGEVSAWAARLAGEGVTAGDRVAVLAFNRGETLAILYACADLGAILFPMNWRLTTAELRWQVDDCDPRVLIADGAHAGSAAEIGHSRVLDMDGCTGPARAFDVQGSSLDSPWMLMYTSGSTGTPKGALLTHRQVHWNAFSTVLACELSAESSTLTFAPLFHTGGMNSLTTPILHRGGRVVLAPRFDPALAIDLVERERVSHLMGVPTIYQALSDHPRFAEADLSSVRDAICGGAPLGASLLRRFQDRGIPLRQGFGLTEVGPNCFSTPPDEVLRKVGSVGRPIHLLDARVVRSDGTDCADGEPGELWLRGPAVFGGYWNRPAATADSLHDGWFRTGDVLSRDAEGFFTVRGRLKEMFISGGENVYPAEVEAVLLQFPGIAHAAVVGVPDDRWGETGHAFLEPAPGERVDLDALARFLDGRLARFKRPRRFTIQETLPRTGAGKIDKLNLSALARVQG